MIGSIITYTGVTLAMALGAAVAYKYFSFNKKNEKPNSLNNSQENNIKQEKIDERVNNIKNKIKQELKKEGRTYKEFINESASETESDISDDELESSGEFFDIDDVKGWEERQKQKQNQKDLSELQDLLKSPPKLTTKFKKISAEDLFKDLDKFEKFGKEFKKNSVSKSKF